MDPQPKEERKSLLQENAMSPIRDNLPAHQREERKEDNNANLMFQTKPLTSSDIRYSQITIQILLLVCSILSIIFTQELCYIQFVCWNTNSVEIAIAVSVLILPFLFIILFINYITDHFIFIHELDVY